jgi:transposase
MGSYVGIDLHRRRSVIVAMSVDGEKLWTSRIENSALALETELARAGEGVDVAMEATWGWYWAADVIEGAGHRLHLAHVAGARSYENRRVKNDDRDATLLADLLRMGRLPEAWIAPRDVRELRELVRYRAKLSRMATGLKAQVHQTLGKEGAIPPTKGIWWAGGQHWLDELELADAYQDRIGKLRELLVLHQRQIVELDAKIHDRLKDDPRYRAMLPIIGVGRVFAAIFIAEIGDATRFRSADALCSWAGLTPRHRESDTKVHRGPITKQGSPLLRWALIEAVTGAHREPRLMAIKQRVGERRGRNIGKVAAARHLLTLVYYGMRDGEIRCLREPLAA